MLPLPGAAIITKKTTTEPACRVDEEQQVSRRNRLVFRLMRRLCNPKELPDRTETKEIVQGDCELETCTGLNSSLKITPDYLRFENYKIEKYIGEGAYGQVYMVSQASEVRHYYALKLMRLNVVAGNQESVENAKTERVVLEIVKGVPFFVQMRSAFRTDAYLGLVLEFAINLDLFVRMFDVDRLSESDARVYVAEIVAGLEFLHENHIIYRDLKLANILLDDAGHVRLSDFGLSRRFSREERREELTYTFCGTVEYMAPEVISKNSSGYSYPVDWWSLGVIAHELIMGDSLFAPDVGVQDNVVAERVLTAEIPFPSSHMSLETIDFISSLLEREPARRLGANGAIQVKEHAFFRAVDWNQVANRTNEMPRAIKMLTVEDSLVKGEKNEFSFDETMSNVELHINDPFKDWNYESGAGPAAGGSSENNEVPKSIFKEKKHEPFLSEYSAAELSFQGFQECADHCLTRACKKISTDSTSAIKVVKRAKLPQEVKKWKACCVAAANLVPAISKVYYGSQYTFIVHDFVPYELMFAQFTRQPHVTELTVSKIMKQLVSEVALLHDSRITHGNLSAFVIQTSAIGPIKANVMFNKLKITDFSSVTQHGSDGGTQFRQAMAADQRRLGILMFTLLFGRCVKLTRDGRLCAKALLQSAEPAWNTVSTEARSILLRLLTANESNVAPLSNISKRSQWLLAPRAGKSVTKLNSPKLVETRGCMETCRIMDLTATVLDSVADDDEPEPVCCKHSIQPDLWTRDEADDAAREDRPTLESVTNVTRTEDETSGRTDPPTNKQKRRRPPVRKRRKRK